MSIVRYITEFDYTKTDGSTGFVRASCTDVGWTEAENLELSFTDEYGNEDYVAYDKELFDEIERQAIERLAENKHGNMEEDLIERVGNGED